LNPSLRVPVVDVKQEAAQTSLLYGAVDDDFQGSSRPSWSQVMPASSPSSCVTSLSSSLLNFSCSQAEGRSHHPENSSEVRHWRRFFFLFFFLLVGGFFQKIPNSWLNMRRRDAFSFLLKMYGFSLA
jgi:hypothetical protein